MHLSNRIHVIFALVLAALGLASTATAATTLTRSERALLAAVNDVRADRGLRPLRVDPTLTRAARAYSATLVRRDVFTHGDLGRRLARAGARGPVFGENLAWGTGSYATARGIVRGWLRSPGHRANLLRPGWTRIGLGRAVGTFRGVSGAAVVTADFAGR
jgi:uncharacterized protein YkwD